MARPKIDPSKLQGMVNSARAQEAKGGFSLTEDPNFPIMPTPVNKKVLIYIPTVGLSVDEGGVANWDILNALVHRYKAGQYTQTVRCIHGLMGNEVFDEFGYDGNCPACDATAEGWKLYNAKLDYVAAMKGIDRQADTADLLKDDRKKANEERVMDGSEEFLVFPVVEIPWDAKNQCPDATAMEGMKSYFVYWRKDRYEDSLMKQVGSLIPAPNHPAGLFWLWDFTYDTGGKQANARDSAKNASYAIIQSPQLIQQWEPLKQRAEEISQEFTLYKAAEVIIPVQFPTKAELTRQVAGLMNRTRTILARLEGGATAAEIFGGTAAPANQANPLLNAGGNGGAAPAQLGGAPNTQGGAAPQGGTAPAQLGAAPAQLGGAQGGGQPQGQPQTAGAGWGQSAQ